MLRVAFGCPACSASYSLTMCGLHYALFVTEDLGCPHCATPIRRSEPVAL